MSLNMQKPVTMQQIARLAGVSRPAVSAVLNNRENSSIKVSQEKRERILDIARNLKYRPNLAAIQLTGKRDKAVGIVHSCYVFGIHDEMIRRLAIQLRLAGYKSFFVPVTDPRQELETLNELASRGFAGILASYSLVNLKQQDYPMPVVMISENLASYDIGVDLKTGFHTMTRHLLAHGHRRIGFLCSTLKYNALKLEGLREALAEAGIPWKQEYLVELSWNTGFAEQILNLIRKERVTAFAVAGDLLANRFMHWLRRQGLRVPEDIALFGTDGLEAANQGLVPLTTIVQPLDSIARRAVNLLLEKIEQPGRQQSPGKPELIQPLYRISRSCGCPEHQEKTIYWEGIPLTLEHSSPYIEPPPPELEAEEILLTQQEILKLL